MKRINRSRLFAPVLAITLGLGALPMTAQAATSAELQTQLDQASQQLSSLYSAAEQAGYDLDRVTTDLNNTNGQITDLEGQIETQQAELKTKQSQLGDILATQYKNGDETGLLSLILSSSDFGDLVSNVHYANKISEQKQDAIHEVRELQDSLEKNKSELEEQKSEQEQLVADQQAKSDSANAAAAEAQSYYDQLSDEVKQKLAEEEAAARAKAEEEAKAAAAAAAQKAAEEEAAQQGSGNTSNGGNSSSNTSNNSSNNSNTSNNNSSNNSSNGSHSSNASNGGSTGGSGSSSSSSSTPSPTGSVSTFVSRALSVVGSGYSWSGYRWTGSTSSSYFTCSGLVDYALGLPSNSNWPESLYSQVSIKTSISSLNYGDLVFYQYGGRYPGHVGIYIGGGQIVDSQPGGGVQVRSVTYPGTFIGGGAIL